MTVKNIYEKTGDARHQSPEQCLSRALSDVGKKGTLINGKKILVLCLDDTDGQYDLSWYNAGMHMSECVTICEVSKTMFLEEMGYLVHRHD